MAGLYDVVWANLRALASGELSAALLALGWAVRWELASVEPWELASVGPWELASVR